MRTWQRGTAGLLVAAVGVAFIVVIVVNHLFSVGPAFERMSDGFRPAMKPAPITALQKDLAGFQALGNDFRTNGVPKLSAAFDMTPTQFTAMMQTQFPAVATGMDQLPAVVKNFQGVVGTLKAEQSRFASADAIPTSSLPATSVPWGLLAAGILVLAFGLLIAVRPGLSGPVLALALGAALLVAPLVMTLPHKASAADTMNSHLKPVYTSQMLAGAGQSLTVMQAMGTQMQNEMIPAIGARMGMDGPQVQAFIQQNLPTLGAGIQAMPQAMGHFTGMIKVFRAHLADYDTVKPVAFVPIVWTMIVGGIVTFVGGALALFAGRRRVAAPAEEVTHLRAA